MTKVTPQCMAHAQLMEKYYVCGGAHVPMHEDRRHRHRTELYCLHIDEDPFAAAALAMTVAQLDQKVRINRM